jgi:hypothetical protein
MKGARVVRLSVLGPPKSLSKIQYRSVKNPAPHTLSGSAIAHHPLNLAGPIPPREESMHGTAGRREERGESMFMRVPLFQHSKKML